MALISLSMPPGIIKGGTRLQASGYWNDGNLIRWRDAILQPVYGWRARTTSAMTGTCRALFTWRDNSADITSKRSQRHHADRLYGRQFRRDGKLWLGNTGFW